MPLTTEGLVPTGKALPSHHHRRGHAARRGLLGDVSVWGAALVPPCLNFIQAHVLFQWKACSWSSMDGKESTCLVFAAAQEMMAEH